MEYSVKDVQACEKEITIKVGPEIITEVRTEFFDEAAKDANLPGFRKGKAPRKVIEEHFADKAQEEVLRKIISFAVKKISDSEGLKLISYPNVKDVNFLDTELTFKVDVELEPEVEVADYSGIKVKKPSVEVKEEEINSVVERVRDSLSSFEPVDRAAELDDFLIADYETQFGDKPKEDHKEEMIQIKDIDYLGDFPKHLVGVKAGETKNFKIAISKDHPNPELKNKEAEFWITVKDVKIKKVPELNDDLANKAGGYKTVDEFKKAIEDDIKKQKDQELQSQVERDLMDRLIEKNSFQVSRGVVDRHLKKMVSDGVQRLMQSGQKQEEAEKQVDRLRKDLKPEAEKQVRLAFILEKVAEKENIKVEKSDLDTQFQKMSVQYHVPVEKIQEHFKGQDQISGLVNQILNEKVIQLIKDKATIENS